MYLDKKLLEGGVTLSEKVVELIKNADIFFVHGAYWSSIMTQVAAIERYLKSEILTQRKHQII